MDAEDIKFADNIKRIAGTDEKTRFPVMSGKVLSVNTEDMTADVLLTVDADGDETYAVPANLNVINGNTDGMYLIPADNADCEVAEIDGPGKWSMIRASKYVKASIKVGDAVITAKDGKFNIKNGSKDFKTIMDTHFDNLAQMTFTNGAGTTSPANNVTALNTDKSNFDELFY